MRQTGEAKVWTVEVLLDETPDETQAEALLEHANGRLVGGGRARRNPADPTVPRVGEELAAGRALSDLAHKLLEAAAERIEAFEGRPVQVHE